MNVNHTLIFKSFQIGIKSNKFTNPCIKSILNSILVNYCYFFSTNNRYLFIVKQKICDYPWLVCKRINVVVCIYFLPGIVYLLKRHLTLKVFVKLWNAYHCLQIRNTLLLIENNSARFAMRKHRISSFKILI